jgi:hypothetical protein
MDKTIDMARKAGAADIASHGWTSWVGTQSTEFLKRFEALVRADERDKWMERAHTMILGEREACAKVCDEQVERSLVASAKAKRITDQRIYDSAAQTSEWNAAAIRARGNT